MSAATAVDPIPVPRWASAARVVGGVAEDRRHVRDLLADAGFDVDGDGDVAQASGGALVVVLGEGTETMRLSEIRTVAAAEPEAQILAVMPAGAPNTSLRRALLAGAGGIVIDDDLAGTLVATAAAMLAGQLAVPSSLGRQIAPRPLSHREKQVLNLVVLGYTNREIADQLYLAESTVKTHLSSAFRKLDARSRAEAVAKIVDPDVGYGMAILGTAGVATPPGRAAPR